MSEKNIYQRLNDVRNEVEYLKRGSAGQGTGVLYDEVVALSRKPMLDAGVMITVDIVASKPRMIVKQDGRENYVYEGLFQVNYINMDDPKDMFSNLVEAHAMDSGDKAPGKAVTYATKTSLVKTLFLETGINDEKRYTDSDNYTDDQYQTFHDMIADEKALELFMFTKSIPENNYIALYNSFEKGKISKGKAACSELVSKGASLFQDLIISLNDMAKDGDIAITEEVADFPDYARRLIGSAVEPDTLKFIKAQMEAQS